MKCFIHAEIEAQAVCKRCGKAMCINCSSFTKHSGECPVCYRKTLNEKANKCLVAFTIETILIVIAFVLFMMGYFKFIYLVVPAILITLIVLNFIKIAECQRQIKTIDIALEKGNKNI